MLLFLKLAWRNIWRHKRRTIILVLSVSLCLGMMMWYDGVMEGFQDSIYANAIKVLGGNIQVHMAGYKGTAGQDPMLGIPNGDAVITAAKTQSQVIEVSRRIQTGGLANNREGAFSVSIIGIEPELEAPVNLMSGHVTSGKYLSATDRDQAFIGQGLADMMSLKVGDTFTLTGKALHNQMRKRTVTVTGIYDLGMRDVEKKTVYISLTEAQDLYGLTGTSNEIVISLKNMGQEPEVMNAIKASVKGIEIESWQTSMPEMQNAISTKNGVMNIFSNILLVVAGIGIFNLLLMAVYERTREIGVLGALGMKSGQITWLFLLEGAMMGLVGAAAGVILGLAINISLQKIGMDFSAFSSVSEYMALVSGKLYPTLGLDKLPGHVIVIVFIALLASIYPASQASRKNPAEALHFV